MSTAEPPDEQPTEQVPPAAPPPPPAAVPPPQPAVHPHYAYDPAAAVWIAPPRTRWIHPERRAAAIAIAAVSALVLLFVGGVAGAAITRHHDRVVEVRFPGAGRFQPYDGNGNYGGPVRPFPRGSMPMMPTPTPSKT